MGELLVLTYARFYELNRPLFISVLSDQEINRQFLAVLDAGEEKSKSKNSPFCKRKRYSVSSAIREVYTRSEDVAVCSYDRRLFLFTGADHKG